MILCDICGEKVETKSALYSHRYRRHKDRTKSIELHIRTSEEPKVIDTVPLDLHLHQAIEDPLDKYLKDRNNRYDAKDFDNYLKEMKSKDKKSVKDIRSSSHKDLYIFSSIDQLQLPNFPRTHCGWLQHSGVMRTCAM